MKLLSHFRPQIESKSGKANFDSVPAETLDPWKAPAHGIEGRRGSREDQAEAVAGVAGVLTAPAAEPGAAGRS